MTSAYRKRARLRRGAKPCSVSTCVGSPAALCTPTQEARMPTIRFVALGAALAAGISASAAGPAAARGSVGVFIGAGPPVYYAPPPPPPPPPIYYAPPPPPPGYYRPPPPRYYPP